MKTKIKSVKDREAKIKGKKKDLGSSKREDKLKLYVHITEAYVEGEV